MLRVASMNFSPQSMQDFNSGTAKAKTAALWLYLVSAATVLNSLILFKYRFIDLLIGLSFTQFIDAILLVCNWNRRGRLGGIQLILRWFWTCRLSYCCWCLPRKRRVGGVALLGSVFGCMQSTPS
jgi:hypothetical protein